ncbi:hypothetical protein B4119_3344 [Parageobacillus caldoxylosilyticus]|uniref:Tail spike domain-containing protein n=1 Tax=Saccharococcus caldoxylosilyticus TaxID=81408 RepID=A0A150KXX8_9BACL|nr:hypothetical protein B4119_3344 [Parageobacillus caldoxylosilyticus]
MKQIASEFNLELHFRVETDGNKVTRRYVDLIEHVGGWNGREVEFGKDLMGIERKEDFSNIVTALVGIGPERDDGTRLQVFVEDKDALARWGRNGKHLVDVYEPDSIDSNMTLERLRSLTEAELSKRINSVVEYTADVADLEKVPGLEHEKFRFGDTIRIKDTAFAPPLYLEARIHTVERSIKRDGQKTVTLGDYIEYTEEDVFAIYKRLQAEIAKKVSLSKVMEVTYTKEEIDTKDTNVKIEAAQDATNKAQQAEESAKQYTETYAEKKIYRGLNPPSNPAIDTLWLDTSVTPNVLKRWNGSTWVKATPTTASEVGAYTKSETDSKLAIKANQSDLDALTTRVSVAESSITQLSNEIQLKVNQSDYDVDIQNLQSRISNAESTLTIHANEIATKVEQDGVISAINQSPESIKIQVSKIDITGAVTFSSLDSELQTKVNNGDSAKATVDNWKVPGKTTIDGSKIETESITWDKAKGGTLTLGGSDNQNGRLVVLDANGEEIADLDATKGGFTNLYVANLDSPSTIKYSDQDYTFYVSDRKLTSYAGAVDPDDSNDGTSWAKPLATIGEALRRIPKYFDGTANIYINSGGILYQDIDLRGFIGKGAIYINGQSTSTRMNGNIIINSNLCHIYISNLTVNGRAGSYAVISSAKNSFVDFTNVIVYGNNSTRGFDIVQSGYTQVQSCQIYDCDHAISGRYSATVWVKDCSGYGNVYGLYVYGGYIVGYGTAPNGATFKAESVGGKIFATHTANNGAYTPPPPPTTTSVWTSTGGDSWRDNFGGQWYGTGEVVQGYWGGYGIYKGLWFFGSAPSSAVTGKTIKSMRLYVTRNASGGNSGAVTVYFRPHTYTSRPSGNPSFLSPYTTATFKWGEGKWITLPSSFYSVFQSGQAKGIGIYIDSTSSSYYAKFSGTAKLEITYA